MNVLSQLHAEIKVLLGLSKGKIMVYSAIRNHFGVG
jgi:hypothetical protein